MSFDSNKSITKIVSQAAHGFLFSEVLRVLADGTYIRAQADTAANAKVVGMISRVIDANTFELTLAGAITGFPPASLVPTNTYFLSPTIAGSSNTSAPTTAGQYVVQIMDVDTTATGIINISDPEIISAGSPASALTKDINQLVHGFSVGNWVYYTGTAYALADADSVITTDSVGVISAVADLNNFTITMDGYVTGLAGLTAGSRHYISGTAGAITATAPSNAKAVLIADSATSGYVQQFNQITTKVTRTINQTVHGFAVNQWVHISAANTYALADSDTYPAYRAIGVVTQVIDANNFVIQTAGYVTGLTGLTANNRHYVSSTAGAITITPPTSGFSYKRVVLVADSTTSGYIVIQDVMSTRAGTPEGTTTGSLGDLAWDTTNSKIYIKNSGTNTTTGWVEPSPTVVRQYANIARTGTGAGTTTPATDGGDNYTLKGASQKLNLGVAMSLVNNTATAGFTIDTVTNQNITVNALGAGNVRIHISANLNASGGRQYLQIVKNNATVLGGGFAQAGSTGGVSVHCTIVVALVNTDFIDFRFYQGPSASTTTINAYNIYMEKV